MIYENIISTPGKKFALLIDPDNYSVQSLIATVYAANEAEVDCILIGGSLVDTHIGTKVEVIKKNTDIPVLLFPGSIMQLTDKVDAILLLTLISGRNPDYLIGNHVLAASYIKKSRIEVIPTGYILIESENTTSVEYISNTKPIPADKIDLAVSTAIAGELTGNKVIYLEAGSGAAKPVSERMIREVKRNISIPLLVGGGMKHETDIIKSYEAGADIVVVGNAVEKNLNHLQTLARSKNSL
jgi:phosphoglycerol geranylgeranyltransferase